MIISCPSCQASFRVDAARLGPAGNKVRCSKCGNVWRAMPNRPAEPESAAMEDAALAHPAAVSREDIAAPAPDDHRPARTFTARDDGEDSPESGVSGQEPAEEEDVGDGLTGEQRARLAAARAKKQPRGAGFWIKVLAIFVVVAGLLLVAQKMGMVPPTGSKKAGTTTEKPANDVAPVDAKPAQTDADPGQQGGHIVGGPLPENTDQPAQ